MSQVRARNIKKYKEKSYILKRVKEQLYFAFFIYEFTFIRNSMQSHIFLYTYQRYTLWITCFLVIWYRTLYQTDVFWIRITVF